MLAIVSPNQSDAKSYALGLNSLSLSPILFKTPLSNSFIIPGICWDQSTFSFVSSTIVGNFSKLSGTELCFDPVVLASNLGNKLFEEMLLLLLFQELVVLFVFAILLPKFSKRGL